jgi:MFS transporter, DHA1 family, multidrug resistance protein
MKDVSKDGLKAPAFAALALAFASFGDAFLYPFLPVNFNDVGIPVVWVGLLLSVNRFVRILANTVIVHALAKYGLRSVMIVAVMLAVVSTLGYGIATGLIVPWVMHCIRIARVLP